MLLVAQSVAPHGVLQLYKWIPKVISVMDRHSILVRRPFCGLFTKNA
jgi:hypothetical protein